jgi:NAD(P)-dependent dehydrogenase (short-subunit alcohol dehydrogenase family)
MTKWTAADIPDQTGRTAVITGANTGLGYETAAALAGRGARVVLAVRNLEKGKQAVARITAATPGAEVELQELDLTSLESVRAAAARLRSGHDRIDLLINNAGVMYTPRSTTKDGFELQFGTNHLGHFAFTGLLLDRLLPVAGSRVVTVSSVGHRIRAAIHFDDLQWERRYSRVGAYGQSKLANLLFTYELQRRLAPHGTTIAVAAHPGGSNTELMRNLPRPIAAASALLVEPLMQGADLGALPTLRAATDPGVLGGQYFGPDGFQEIRGYPKVVASSAQSHDVELQRRLWAVSEELTGVVYPVSSLGSSSLSTA